MMNNQLKTFTDRREAIALFDLLRGRDPNQPWPLLPIIAFIAPSGCGKSMLIDYLRSKHCCLQDGRAAIPYTYLDFTLADTPKSPLPILVTLRNQLQQHDDGQGKHLVFPRFDLGAAIALATPKDGKLPLLELDEIQRSLSAGLPFFERVNEMGNALGNALPIIPPLLVGLKWITQIPALQTLLQRLEKGAGWRWYLTHGSDIGLQANADIRDVLMRLYMMSSLCEPGKQGREYLEDYLLPAAFIADLRDAFDNSKAWSKTTNVVLFLDGFDALVSDAENDSKGIPFSRGIRLLEMLALSEHRKRGETDPLLLVIGSNRRLLDLRSTKQHPPFERLTAVQDQLTAQEQARKMYEQWYKQLPRKKSVLRLKDLYLPLWLHDFGLADTRDYLSQLSEQSQQVFLDDTLIEAIHHITNGHPFYLALIASAISEMQTRGQDLKLDELEQALVSPTLVFGHEDETIRDYLLSLFLRQLPKREQHELVFCAVPRTLDIGTLRAVLQLPSDIEAHERWNRYRHFTFARLIDDKRIVFHPILRTLLLQGLVPDYWPESDYYRAHARLREHFRRGSRNGDEQAQIEEAYHALALGDPEPAITLALTILINHNLSMFYLFLSAVEQAPTKLMPLDTKERASKALDGAMAGHEMRDHVTALILYSWLGSTSPGDTGKTTSISSNPVRSRKEARQ